MMGFGACVISQFWGVDHPSREHFEVKWIPVYDTKMRPNAGEHFEVKWIPVYDTKMRPNKDHKTSFGLVAQLVRARA